MKRLHISFILFFVAFADARAGLTLSLTAAVQNGAQGTELVFSGTLTSTNLTTKIFLNDVAVSLTGASAANLSLKPNTFFSNVPGILLPGESYTSGELFRMAIGSGAPSGDYGGTVIFRGGDDITKNDDLASANFVVLSPAVSIVATDASASELGPDPGTFTISRSGGTGIGLNVTCTVSGTALNGTAYDAIASTASIAAGSGSVTVTITPIPNNVADGDRTVVLTLDSSSSYNPAASVSDTVTIHDKPADQWRLLAFGANANDPAAADAADWDGDGIKNLLEYALNLDPKVMDVGSLPAAGNSGGYLTLSFVPNPAATDLSYVVQASTDLIGWTTSDVEDVTGPNPNPPGQRTYRYKNPVGLGGHAFLRLRVSRSGQ